MSANLVLIDMLGAAALLLWGLRMIKTGMLRAFGASLRAWIAWGTSNRFTAAGVGLLATLAVQSSTATAVITASFAARDLMSGAMAQAVMLGANIGTGLAAAFLSLDLHWLSPLLILIGVTVFSRSGEARGKGIGRAVLGLGLMLLALNLLGEATQPVRDSPVVATILGSISQAPFLGLIFGSGLAFLASSSLAVVLFVVLLADSGVITPVAALVLVAGANLGGAIPPYVAIAGEGVEARRVATANLAVRTLGALVLTVSAPWLAPWLSRMFPDTGHMALAAHIGFSLTLLVIFMPLLTPLTRLVERMLPAGSMDVFGPRYLDEAALATPTIAVAAAARETLRLGDMIHDQIEGSMHALQGDDPGAGSKLTRIEENVDTLYLAIKSYIARLDRAHMDADDIKRADEVLAYAVNLEHVGDIVDTGLVELSIRKARRGYKFSAEGLSEITAFYRQTLDIMQTAQSVFFTRDADLARRLVAQKPDVRRLESESAERHMERLRAQRTETMETSGMHLDVLRDLRRVNAHLISVAYPILDDLGALRETRLKPVDGDGEG
ncbi:Na/Pi cotransporter family protein [Aureimonas frigidaquae]|uniref:Na/Pi cotransporter family protein n=1 Tax=Aureimonas frigidaquae TaxID=424757 RepID=UPI000A4E13E4|nr:Na/Pi cotransporter family protein [Aureimonas frigidaquae]